MKMRIQCREPLHDDTMLRLIFTPGRTTVASFHIEGEYRKKYIAQRPLAQLRTHGRAALSCLGTGAVEFVYLKTIHI